VEFAYFLVNLKKVTNRLKTTKKILVLLRKNQPKVMQTLLQSGPFVEYFNLDKIINKLSKYPDRRFI